MIFLSLFLDLLWMLGGAGVFATADSGAVFVPPEHRTHGHLNTVPPDGHDGDAHIHHGQHGHTVPSDTPAGGNHQTPPHLGG